LLRPQDGVIHKNYFRWVKAFKQFTAAKVQAEGSGVKIKKKTARRQSFFTVTI
jgi:hypothetical protein